MQTWHQQAGERRQQQFPGEPGEPGEMSRDEALQVLGLKSDTSEEEVVEAHRRLMHKLHSDPCESSYLSAVINKAKDMLLDG